MSNMPETRDSLIIQIQAPENRVAWDEFTQIYRPGRVSFSTRGRGLQDADAEDLTQQVLMSVARAVPQWQRNPNTRFRQLAQSDRQKRNPKCSDARPRRTRRRWL